MKQAFLVLILALQPSFTDAADFCARYKSPVQIGALNPKVISESSGIAISSKFSNRLYHNNDSGDDANFYITDFSGTHTQQVAIKGHTAIDIEDMALGSCGENKTCLYLGDIGDNKTKRDSITILMVEELAQFPSTVSPLKKITLRYPDRAHNAESLIVHPNGDIFILTKEFSESDLKVSAAQVFKISADEIAKKTSATLTKVGELDIPYLNQNLSVFGQILTAADITSDGTKILTLTYENAIEFKLDLNGKFLPTKDMQEGKDFEMVNFPRLEQQEALAYLPDNKSFLYTSEGDGETPAPIMKLECAE